LAGDYNGDGTVNAADYTVWRNHLGENFMLPNEDLNTTPGQVTMDDFDFWKAHFGESIANPAGNESTVIAVPEPLTQFMLLAGVLAMCAADTPRNRKLARF